MVIRKLIQLTNYHLALCPHAFLLSADFFQNQFFQKILSGIPSECQTDWIQIRPDILSGLIWVQSVSKVMSRRTSRQRVKRRSSS